LRFDILKKRKFQKKGKIKRQSHLRHPRIPGSGTSPSQGSSLHTIRAEELTSGIAQACSSWIGAMERMSYYLPAREPFNNLRKKGTVSLMFLSPLTDNLYSANRGLFLI
jgi:hypothetical protein